MTSYSGKIIRKNPVLPTQASASGVWTMTDAAAAVRSNTWPIASVPDPISRSLRFRSSASAYLNRTPTVSGSSTTWTLSCWIKRGALGASSGIFYAGALSTSSDETGFQFRSDDTLQILQNNGASTVLSKITTQVFRDPSAWYHFVLTFDTTNATAEDRVRLYVNGVRVTSFSTNTNISLSGTTYVNSSSYGNRIFRDYSTSYVDGYLTEVNFIDGQALTPSSFGTTNPNNGAWIPMTYTGTYGTNGFYLNFKDNTNTTTLGYDYSGNNNNWTANNISLTAGVTYDSMLDTPTNWVGYNTGDGSAVTRGNYCVMNPLNQAGSAAPSGGNLTVVSTGNGNQVAGTIGMTTGKWYYEHTITAVGGQNSVGIGSSVASGSSNYVGVIAGQYGYYSISGDKYTNGTNTAYGASYTTGDVIGVAYDADAGSLTFYKNGTSQGVAFTGITGTMFPIASTRTTGGTNTSNLNFGQRPFTYTVPTGFKTLCTTNLSTPTIVNGAQYMAATTYSGTGAVQNIVNSGNNTTSTTFQPDLLWIKCRSSIAFHDIVDSVRGVNNALSSNSTAAEAAGSFITSLNSNGFTLPANVTSDAYYTNIGSPANTFVGWQWKAGGTSVTNTNGTITSTVNANTTAGFSIVTYTGTGANATVGHGLNFAPAMIIVKNRTQVSAWAVGHQSMATSTPWAGFMVLNTNAAYTTASGSLIWNSTAPTSTVFSVGTDTATNFSGNNLVAYCWAEVAGYSKFGSYTGNASTDGPFVYTGFRPRFILFKSSSTGGANYNWFIYDTSTNTYNVMSLYEEANTNAAEQTYSLIDVTANGFKLRNASTYFNGSGITYIYACFAELPFNYSNAR